MRADDRFLGQSKEFWANVRTISQAVGYTRRAKGGSSAILIPTLEEIRAKFASLALSTAHITAHTGELTPFGQMLFSYFQHRAEILNDVVRTLLMNKDEAKTEFELLVSKLEPTCPLPMNKQKGEKKGLAFLTGIVNILVEANIGDAPCNYDPKP